MGSFADALDISNNIVDLTSNSGNGTNAPLQLAAIASAKFLPPKASAPIIWTAMSSSYNSYLNNVNSGDTVAAAGDAIAMVGNLVLFSKVTIESYIDDQYGWGARIFFKTELTLLDRVGTFLTMAGVVAGPLGTEMRTEVSEQIQFLSGQLESFPIPNTYGSAIGSMLYELGSRLGYLDNADTRLEYNREFEKFKNSLTDLCAENGFSPAQTTTTINNNSITFSDSASVIGACAAFMDDNGNIKGISTIGDTDISDDYLDYNIFYMDDFESEQDQANTVAGVINKFSQDGVSISKNIAKITFADSTGDTNSTATVYGGDVNDVIGKLGGASISGVTTATAGVNDETVISLISDAATTVVQGVTYAVSEVAYSVVNAATATAQFINDQAGNYLSNTFDAYNINAGITAFFSKYGQALASGNLSAGNAAKYFLLEIAEAGLDDTVAEALLSTSMIALRDGLRNGASSIELATLAQNAQMNDSFSKILDEMGFTNAPNLSLQLQESFVKMALEFALHSNGWNAEQYVKAANDNFVGELAMFNLAA